MHNDTALETAFNAAPARWLHTRRDADEVLTVCLHNGQYVVQVTTDESAGADFVGLYDLDGDRVALGNDEWDVVTNNAVPGFVVEQIHATWGGGVDESVVRL